MRLAYSNYVSNVFSFQNEGFKEDREEGKGPFPAVIQQYVSKPKIVHQTENSIPHLCCGFWISTLTACIYNEGLVKSAAYNMNNRTMQIGKYPTFT